MALSPNTLASSIGDLFVAGVAGDDQAWAELVDRLSPAIWAAARSHGLSRDRSEDLAQTVWWKLVEHAGRIEDPERLAGWVSTTARNEARTMLRKLGRSEPTDCVDLTADFIGAGVPDEPPGEIIEHHATSRMLVEGLNTLGQPCQELLRLLAAGTPYRDIADHLDMAVGSIGPTRQRCVDKLRAAPTIRQLTEDAS